MSEHECASTASPVERKVNALRFCGSRDAAARLGFAIRDRSIDRHDRGSIDDRVKLSIIGPIAISVTQVISMKLQQV